MAKKKKPKTSTGGSPTGSAASSASSDSSSNSSTPASSDSAVKTTSEEVKSPPVPASSDSAMKMTSDEVKSPPAPASSDPAVKSNSDEVKSSPISAPASSDPAVVSTSDKVKSLPILAHASTSPDPAANSTSSSDKNVISSAPQTKVAETTATECDANPNSQIPPTSNGVPEVTDHGTLPSLQPATSFAEAAILAETSGPVTTSDTTKASHLPLVDTPSVSAPSKFQINAYVWREKAKLRSSKLDPEGTPFILESGEPCVRIPNSVIEKNRKSWDSFIIGQFCEEALARGAVQAIVNGMWSKQHRDIAVSKMDGNAFLFRVPCPNARRRILSQCLWQIDGQTMIEAKWAPGVTPGKPSLSTVPVWLDFTGVPLQFFNKDALKEIEGLVGHPLKLHPSTENLTNIEVANVYTVIDPRKPMSEAVNAQFESGEVFWITVSCPWLPSLCSHCLKVGHTISRCPSAPPKCAICRSVKHDSCSCPRASDGTANRASRPTKAPSTQRPGKAPIASQFPIVASQETPRNHTLDVASASKVPTAIVASTSKVHKQKRDQRVSSYNTNPRSVGLKMVHLWRLQYKTILHKRWIWKNSISI
ncbi:unnamed protein product [Brassica oleracea var. botrytis]|uniref:DUF4283 domain-containing protein n=3 Tax=Brassica TaxID=3705 RepID=A0A0D3ALJ9_BRAOL|nr:unnamed protein product [Brassica napus]CDY32898.1 BnaC02g11820D [Brassica napus]VDD21147.1 unnamed protein product [Brassica oleracea]